MIVKQFVLTWAMLVYPLDVTQKSASFLGEKEIFDLIIDDASHISEDILSAFQNTYQHLRSGGYYIVEDMKCTYSPDYTAKFKELFRPDAVNDRNVIVKMIDSLMKYIDKRKLLQSSTTQMLVIKL